MLPAARGGPLSGSGLGRERCMAERRLGVRGITDDSRRLTSRTHDEDDNVQRGTVTACDGQVDLG